MIAYKYFSLVPLSAAAISCSHTRVCSPRCLELRISPQSIQLARCLCGAAVRAGDTSAQHASAGSTSTDVAHLVAVLVGGSIERMVSYYACLYAGHAFCPLEAGWPRAVCEEALVSRPTMRLSQKAATDALRRGFVMTCV